MIQFFFENIEEFLLPNRVEEWIEQLISTEEKKKRKYQLYFL